MPNNTLAVSLGFSIISSMKNHPRLNRLLLILWLAFYQATWAQNPDRPQDAWVAAEENFTASRTVTLNLIDVLHSEKCSEAIREKAFELYLREEFRQLPTEHIEKFEEEVTRRIKAQIEALGHPLVKTIADKAIVNSHLVRTKDTIISLGGDWDGNLFGHYIDALFSVSDGNNRKFTVSEIQSHSTVPSLVRDLRKWLGILEVTFKDVEASKQGERDKLFEQTRTTIRQLEQDQTIVERAWKKATEAK